MLGKIAFRWLTLSTLLISYSPKVGFSQDIKSDFAKINQAYLDHPNLSTEVRYKVYESHVSIKPIEHLEATYHKQGDNLYKKIGPYESLTNQQYQLSIDREQKRVILNHSNSYTKQMLLNINLDSALTLCKKHQPLKTLPSGTRGYKMTFREGNNIIPFKAADVVFDTQTFLIKKLVIYYAEPLEQSQEALTALPRMEIEYTKLNLSPQYSDQTFSETQFVRFVAGTPQLLPEYKDYQLVNYTTSRP